MLAINEGKDGVNLGVKDVLNASSLSVGGMNVKDLCSTSSKPLAPPPSSTPCAVDSSPQSFTSASPQSHTGSPHSHTTTTGSPYSNTSPQSHSSHSPSSLSPPVSVSPEHSAIAPPNVVSLNTIIANVPWIPLSIAWFSTLNDIPLYWSSECIQFNS